MEDQVKVDIRNEYKPGVCNIGAAERRARRMIGWMGTAATIMLWVIFILARAPQIWRLFIALPAGMAAAGFLQSAFYFCAGFGMRGVFNFGAEVGRTTAVEEAEFRKKDMQRSMLINFISLLIGAVIAAAAFLIKI